MSFPEVILIILSVSFVSFIFGRMIYRRIKGMPNEECSSCKVKTKKILKSVKKELAKMK